MREYIFEELGFFSIKECERIKECLQGKTYMNFDIAWSNNVGNCTLIIKTDYNDTEEKIKNFFIGYALRSLTPIKK